MPNDPVITTEDTTVVTLVLSTKTANLLHEVANSVGRKRANFIRFELDKIVSEYLKKKG